MSTSVLITDMTSVNSTSYADVAGLEGGIGRLQGETTAAYADRLNHAAVEDRSHSYQGVVNSIAFALGLMVQPGIEIFGPADTVVTCTLSGLSLVSAAGSLVFPLATLGVDDVWDWTSLSRLTAAINKSPFWTAQLLSPDGPAIQLCRQSNASVGMPYECVVSDVGLIGLTESSLPPLAITPSGGLSYQMREYVQSIMLIDKSYWAR